MLYGGIHLYSLFVYIVHYSEKYNCYASVSMTLMWFCTPAHFNKHNVTFIKLGTNDVNMMTSWCYCFPRYNVFGCFSLKETEKMLNFWCKIKLYFTRDHRKSYLHWWLLHSWKYFFLLSFVKYISILNQHSTNILYIIVF